MKYAQLWYLIKWIIMPLKLISIMCPNPALSAEWRHVLRSEREERVKTGSFHCMLKQTECTRLLILLWPVVVTASIGR